MFSQTSNDTSVPHLTMTLHQHDFRVTTRPLKILQQEFSLPKFSVPTEQQMNIVYQIPCTVCDWNYIGETGRAFVARKKKHIRNIKTSAQGFNIANHACKFDHSIDIDNAKIIDQENYQIRKTLESCHAASIKEAGNNSRLLPRQFSILLHE